MYVLINKKPLKFDKKTKRKTKKLIDKKLLKIDKQTRGKTNYLLFYKR